MGGDGATEAELGQARGSGLQRRPTDQAHPGEVLAGAPEHAHLVPGPKRPGGLRREGDLRIHPQGWREDARAAQDLADPHLVRGDPAQGRRRPAARARRHDRLAMDLQLAQVDPAAGGLQDRLVPRFEVRTLQGAGGHGSHPGQAEHPVEGQEGTRQGLRRGDSQGQVADFAVEGLKPLPGHGRAEDDGCRGQEGRLQLNPDPGLEVGAGLLRNEVSLGHRDKAVPEAQEAGDPQVLTGLPAEALNRGDDQQDRPGTGGAHDHGADEVLVAGSVQEVDVTVRVLAEGKAQGDGEAPRLLLRQAVRLHAGQGADQGRLAVVDVPDHRQAKGRRRGGGHRMCPGWRRRMKTPYVEPGPRSSASLARRRLASL